MNILAIEQPKAHFYIDTGRGVGYYTLRQVSWISVPCLDGRHVKTAEFKRADHYVQNLSTDPKKAEQKAREIAQKYGLEFYGSANFELNEWGTFSATNKTMLMSFRKDCLIVFGEKHTGETFAEVCANDPNYIHWILSAAENELADVEAAIRTKRLNRLHLTAIVIKEMIENGSLILPEKKSKQKLAPDSRSIWLGEIGDKIEFQGTVVFCKRFETMYGCNEIFIMKNKNGNVVKFFTTSSTFAPVAQGDWAHIKGTVKDHEEDENRDNNHVTLLTRVKCVDHIEVEAEEESE